jgi:hypothetical protein
MKVSFYRNAYGMIGRKSACRFDAKSVNASTNIGGAHNLAYDTVD